VVFSAPIGWGLMFLCLHFIHFVFFLKPLHDKELHESELETKLLYQILAERWKTKDYS
jgi:hypothetical protein